MSIKRYLAVLLSLLLLFSLVACQTREGADESSGSVGTAETSDAVTTDEVIEESPAEDFYCTENEDGTLTVRYKGNNAHVVVPSAIDGKTVTAIGDKGFHYKADILQTVVLPDTLTKIGAGAFLECEKLTEINLPKSLTSIGTQAFSRCASLKHVDIPAHAFDNGDCSEAFAHSGLETVTLAEGIQAIPASCFHGTAIREITLPSSIRILGFMSFAQTSELTTVTLNQGLEEILSYAFRESSFSEILIPASVTGLEETAFFYSKTLQIVYFEGNATTNYFSPLENAVKHRTFTIYYHEGAEGFASPEWNGYHTNIW